jgi:hypothetical protein
LAFTGQNKADIDALLEKMKSFLMEKILKNKNTCVTYRNQKKVGIIA